MSIRIDGTNTTANPGITGGDADTGLQFGTDEVKIVTGGSNRLVIGNSGITQDLNFNGANIVFSSGSGIDFSATADSSNMTSELLDDYEEGTWTPTFTPSSGTPSYEILFGKYVKIGSVVYVWFMMRGANTTSANLLKMNGLPFTVGGLSARYPGPAIANVYNVGLGTGGTAAGGYWRHNETSFSFHSYGNNTSQLSLSVTASTTFEIRGEGFYPTV